VLIARDISTPSLHVSGPKPNVPIGLRGLGRLSFAARGNAATLRQERWTLDGANVTGRVLVQGGGLVFRPMELLPQGTHKLVVTRSGGFLGAKALQRVFFVVDFTPPVVHLDSKLTAPAWHAVEIRGTVDDDHAVVTVAGRPVKLDHGQFSVSVQPPFTRPIQLVATDVAGNRAVKNLTILVVPRRPATAVHAVHVSAYAWADATLRSGVLALIDQHRINAVELDLKDEGGVIGFDPPLPLARRIGAAQPIYDLPATVRELHSRGVRVIGRLVCFRDPIASAAAWKAGRRDEVVQTPAGTPYSGYGGFTNVANPAVRRYEISIALAAARAGVDDVLYDYVRRPDGPISTMVFPGLHGTPSQAIVEFLRETRIALKPYGTYLGASVFGIAATRPGQVAQDVPAIAHQVDYVAPMVYPSHWNNGEYGVADPNAQPYEIVLRSLVDFKRELAGTGARLVPWLQDFSLGRTYGARQVRAQIAAARALGLREFLLWNPDVTYTRKGLAPNALTSRSGLATPG
jgi:hypothetical protein